jgi:hypothetical protein
MLVIVVERVEEDAQAIPAIGAAKDLKKRRP